MSADIEAHAQTAGVILLWVAVLLRARGAVRCPAQRALWLAVGTAALAMTLNLPVVTRPAGETFGRSAELAEARNLTGVVSAGAVLHFLLATAGVRRVPRVLVPAGCLTIALLLFLDRHAGPHDEHRVAGGPSPSVAYWLIVIGVHLVVNTLCVLVCWHYGRRTESRSLAAGLRLFGLGTAFAWVYWAGQCVRLAVGDDTALRHLPVALTLHALLRAAAILVPVLEAARRLASDARTAWRLWPLWYDLMVAVPQVALTEPRGRVAELLRPLVPRDLLVYRKVIETRDAIIALQGHVPPGALGLARRYVAVRGVPGPRAAAAELACVIAAARAARLAGRPEQEAGLGHHGLAGGGLDAEKAFLVDMAAAWPGIARAFAERTASPSATAK
ncbi:MAB_1171c family putative transporter [Streptomyces sp. NPDC001678]|uniref:MAB_1171c family putative transporter n=1 Tax=Streptomyces sp. NPDC001678 TaxID=3364599 RepID=UPI003695F47F